MNNPKVSVIIPVFNGQQTIAENLKAVVGQSRIADVEVIVVDDGSTDGTAGVVKAFPQIKYVYQNNAGPAAARNAGAKLARGEFLFFTDSDCVPEPDWVAVSLPYFMNEEIAVVAGTYTAANPESRLARCIQAEIEYRHTVQMSDYPKSFGSYNFGIRKKVFDALGGFETAYTAASGEDNDLSYRILKAGHRIFFTRESKVKHFHTVTIKKYLNEQFRHGYWRVKMYMDHPGMARGDGYTFWKDIAEPILVAGFLLFGICSIFRPAALSMPTSLLGGSLLLIEFAYGFRMLKFFSDRYFFSFVMFLRAFARAFGFFMGFAAVFFPNFLQGRKQSPAQ